MGEGSETGLVREESIATRHAAWHALPVDRVLALLETDSDGLDDHEARRRLATHGRNVLELQRPRPWWRVLADQVRNVVVALLAVAAVVATLIGERTEGLAIAAVLAINVAIGFVLEWRARLAMDALQRLEVQRATVVREGRARTCDASELVPGDVLVVEAGEAVPADARVIEVHELSAVEAPLTGESLPSYKDPAPVAENAALAERSSMLFKGTMVAAGAGRAVVVATGRETEIGHIGELVAGTREEKTPLERRLAAMGARLVWLTLAIATVTVGLGLLRGRETWLMVETGIALAVAAVPEGLPVIATITLALGMRRMARRRALVRRLPAVETLGSVTVLCTDKTGTLTAGEMTVTQLSVGGERFAVTGQGYHEEGAVRCGDRAIGAADLPGVRLAVEIGVLANRARIERGADATRIWGDPTEAALLVLGRKLGVARGPLLEHAPEVGDVPFSSQRMLMATFHRVQDEGILACVKGAPGQLLERSTQELRSDGKVVELDAAARERLRAENDLLASDGLRVLALAYRSLTADVSPGEEALEALTFAGYAGILDPPAPGVRETIATLRGAGIRVIMITGDQRLTAEAVARDLGVLAPGAGDVLDGRLLAGVDERELAERVARVAVFSRTDPADKLRIVEAFQDRGEIVGMLGDGVNDAPALKRADIGVAMGGRGTDVAKETAALVLVDDRFETIAAAVEEGRVVFDNIRKFLHYLFSCNLSEVLILTAAGVSTLPLPLLPLQILWLNLVTDVFPALALAAEPGDPEVMKRSPRDPKKAILSRRFATRIGIDALVITVAVLAAFLIALGRVEEAESPAYAVTVAFMTLALAQLFHLFNSRHRGPVLWSHRLFQNRWVWGAVVLTLVLQALAVYYPPLSGVLGTVPLSAGDWLLVGTCALAPLVFGQLVKALSRRTVAQPKGAQRKGA
jgi:Ca2+-transporting ATPase